MSKWISGSLLGLVTFGGVAYVLTAKTDPSHCGPCVIKRAETPPTSPCAANTGNCPSCDAAKHSKVVDVADLNRFFNTPDGPRAEISFEEPPLAKPRGEVTPVKFETPVMLEVAPMPKPVD